MYNVIDALQIVVQIPYTVLVIVYRDVELPFLQNNMGTFKDYGVAKKKELEYDTFKVQMAMSILMSVLMVIVFVQFLFYLQIWERSAQVVKLITRTFYQVSVFIVIYIITIIISSVINKVLGNEIENEIDTD